ncbi:phosphoadenosine phosphosulfate reductase domain-containing protein [Alicyclobacillus sendaiensis]|uniref:phosphoadenosine phosphosulfate reductase domain-containing protein n=1 Tax=Alicyclobacillus sendaiensis TaxID=192387 RepID=UPI0026F42901|nr:phosphoadenosine phosphosulfate reductase family protein [Alicyclobacillus sendaiensis]
MTRTNAQIIRKVQRLVDDGWITGIRREQVPTRANAQAFEVDRKFNLVKVNPLATWTDGQVWKCIRDHDVPYNPLHAPCENLRKIRAAGGGSGFEKTECGLHK